jgi:protein SCO1/2
MLPESNFQPQRRCLLALMGLAVVPGSVPLAEAADSPTGWVLPRLAVPQLRLTAGNGQTVSLDKVVRGKVTAVQLMFTGCSSTCGVQGALFGAVASRSQRAETQLLSVSIDALGDTPGKLRMWQAKFGLSPVWQTGVASPSDVSALTDFLRGTSGRSGTHTAQVFLLDRQARLCYRTGDWPAVAQLEALIDHIAHLG